MSPIQSHNLYLASTSSFSPNVVGIVVGCLVGAVIVFFMIKSKR